MEWEKPGTKEAFQKFIQQKCGDQDFRAVVQNVENWLHNLKKDTEIWPFSFDRFFMSQNKEHHIVSKVYLKYFSPNNDGKGISILHYQHPYKSRIEVKDSGNSIFTKRNFYNTSQLENPNEIELFFGREIEQKYNFIMAEIAKEKDISDYELKIKIMEWIFYSKIRSPMWRKLIQSELELKGYKFAFNSKELREEHLQLISNNEVFEGVLEIFDKNLSAKKWFILKSPSPFSFITSDNPGFSINVEDYNPSDKMLLPNAFWTNIRYDTVLYFPLSKNYCLRMQPYNNDDDVQLNISNTPIRFQIVSEDEQKLINSWTFCTHDNLLIASDKRELNLFENIKNKS